MRKSTKNTIGNAVVWTIAFTLLVAFEMEVLIGLENMPQFLNWIINIW